MPAAISPLSESSATGKHLRRFSGRDLHFLALTGTPRVQAPKGVRGGGSNARLLSIHFSMLPKHRAFLLGAVISHKWGACVRGWKSLHKYWELAMLRRYVCQITPTTSFRTDIYPQVRVREQGNPVGLPNVPNMYSAISGDTRFFLDKRNSRAVQKKSRQLHGLGYKVFHATQGVRVEVCWLAAGRDPLCYPLFY